ncbi:MAG: cytochrome C oxidase subunit IV family protein [Anaerolineales bacterium]|nr:cytochrome C oxidase subunit IV family protein [Anaerolineales bacterium]
MSDAAATRDVVVTHGEEVKPHKSPNYLAVFLALAAITAIITITELYIDYIPVPKEVIWAGFVVMSLVKATLVAMYYMHLKFDSFVYTILFLTPVMFAVLLVGILAVGYLI